MFKRYDEGRMDIQTKLREMGIECAGAVKEIVKNDGHADDG